MKIQVKERPFWIETWLDIRRGTDYGNQNKLHGCLIIKTSFQVNKAPSILSYGQNAERPSPFIRTERISMHAEMNAIYRLPRNRGKPIFVDMVVFRVNRHNDLKESLPCSLCMECIENTLQRTGYLCRKVWFSTGMGVFIGRRFSDLYGEFLESQRCGKGWGPKRDESRRKN